MPYNAEMTDREHAEWQRDEQERKKHAEAGKTHYVHKPTRPEDDDSERRRREEEEELKRKKLVEEEEEDDDDDEAEANEV